jgi:hypothetical protein
LKSKHKACSFHFGQNLHAHLADYRLTTVYATDPDFRMLMHKFKALAYLPPREIHSAFQALKASLPENVREYAGYFRRTFVGSIKKPATFPPNLWSQAELLDAGLPRTQNSAEAWHKW